MSRRIAIWTGVAMLGLVVVFCCVPMPGGKPYHPPAQFTALNELDLRTAFGHHVRRLLASERYDQLDQLADSLERHRPAWPSGRLMITSFYDLGFANLDEDAGSEDWVSHLAQTRQWMDARPGSVAARIALATALVGRAIAAHGDIRNASSGRTQSYTDLEQAREILGVCPDSARSNPDWERCMLHVLHEQGDDAAYRALCEHAIARYPDRHTFYTHAAIHFMPSLYGRESEFERFAQRVTESLPDSIADEFYARIVVTQLELNPDVFGLIPGLSWKRTIRGLDDWHRRWPRSTQPLSALAKLAWQQHDRPNTERAFAALGDTMEVEIWVEGLDYWTARAWAASGDK